MADPLLPDAESLVVAQLASLPAIVAITPRIGTRIASEPVYPLIRIQQVAGSPNGDGASAFALVQVDCWADDDATASLLARTVVAGVRDLRAMTVNGWLALTNVATGPIPTPDPDSERHRYIVDLECEFGY